MRPSDLIPPDAPERVKASTLSRWLGVSGHAIRDWVKAGRFPAPLRLTTRTHWYYTAEVREALDRGDLVAAAAPREACRA